MQIRGNLAQYSDIYTPAALERLKALAAARPRPPGADGSAARPSRRTRAARPRDRVPESRTSASARTSITVRDARAGDFEGTEIPRDLQRQWIQGTGPAAKPNTPLEQEHPQRRLRAAVGRRRLDVRRRGRARAGGDDVARQSAQPEARRSIATERFLAAAEQVAAEMNAWADGFLGRRIVNDWRAAARLHDAHLPAARPPPRRSAPPARRRRGLLRLDRRRRRSTSSTTTSGCAASARRSCSTCRRFRPPKKPRCGTTSSRRWSCTSACRRARSRPTCSSSRSKRASS